LIIIYTPEGGEPEEYDARSLKVSEATLVQNTIGMKWAEISKGLEVEDLDAMRGIVWVMKRRGNPNLRIGDVDPGVDEMVTRWSRREVTGYVEEAFRIADTNPEATREDIALALAELPQAAADPEHAEQLIARLVQVPKDQPEQAPAQTPLAGADGSSSPSPTSSLPETPTSDSSLTSAASPLTESTG
jgi:hypothetical protein